MLVLLLAYFFTQSRLGETAPISSIETRDSSSCNDLNSCRSLSNIIWSCLTTIFLCTWVAVHPNIAFRPDEPDVGWLKEWLWNPLRHFMTYKLPLFLVALLVPEYILAWAIRQHVRAGEIREQVPSWTRTHGFFAIMGGFHLFQLPVGASLISIPLKSGTPSGYYIAPRRPCNDEIAAYPLRFDDVPVEVLTVITPTEAELKDRGKSDVIGKAIVLVQTLWFVVQCIARGLRNLPLTELEVVTLAYAMMNFFTYLFWWNKPRDVGCPIRVYKEAATRVRQRSTAEDEDWTDKANRILNYIVGNQDDDQILSQEPKTPMFWSDGKVGSTVDGTVGQYSTALRSLLGPSILGMGFGAIHCIAWNSEFPTHAEFILWRISCIAMMAIPLCATLICAIHLLQRSFRRFYYNVPLDLVLVSCGFLLLLTMWLYIVSRIATIVVAFTTLRLLPSSAFIVVDWTTLFPHL